MLNSFPGDPLLPNIQPHSRMYAPTYITRQLKSNTVLGKLMPIIMLDDVQELYPDQRKHLNAGIPTSNRSISLASCKNACLRAGAAYLTGRSE